MAKKIAMKADVPPLPLLECRVEREAFMSFLRGLNAVCFDGPITFAFAPGNLAVSSAGGSMNFPTTGAFTQMVQLARRRLHGLSRGGKGTKPHLTIRLDRTLKEFSVDHWGGKAMFS